MLRLRPDQVALLHEQSRANVCDELEQRILLRQPQLQALDRRRLREFARLAIDKGQRYAVHKLGDVERVSRAMLVLGAHMDEDSILPAFRHRLIAEGPAGQRVRSMLDDVASYLRRVHGEHRIHLFRALARIRTTVVRKGDGIFDLLQAIYPEKVAEMEWPSAYARGMETCKNLGYDAPEQHIVYFVHALVLGAGFFKDPIYEPFHAYVRDPVALREHSLRLLERTGVGS